MGQVKLKIVFGDAELEFEGERADAEKMAADWWSRITNDEPPAASPAGESPAAKTAPEKGQRRKTARKSPKQNSNSPTPNGSEFDANSFANTLKGDPDLAVIQEKILDKRDLYNKVALVCWKAGQPLTSGDVHRALTALRVKADLPGISNSLNKNSNNFLMSHPRKSGGPPPKYHLSAAAEKGLQKLLNE